MKKSTGAFLTTLFVVLLASMMSEAQNSAPSRDGVLPHKRFVRVINQLDFNVTVHCKSKDDDIGIKTLLPMDYNNPYAFHFRPNYLIGGVTLFFCSFRWLEEQEKHFDI